MLRHTVSPLCVSQLLPKVTSVTAGQLRGVDDTGVDECTTVRGTNLNVNSLADVADETCVEAQHPVGQVALL